MSERAYSQEVMAEFLTDGGAVFKSVDASTQCKPSTPAEHKGHTLYMGIDWGKSKDQTVVTIVKRKGDDVVTTFIKAFELGTSYNIIIDYIEGLIKRFNVTAITADMGAGVAQIDEMLSRNIPVDPFSFSVNSKRDLYSNLRRLMERKELKIPRLTEMINEMRAFQYEITSYGNMKLYHPAGGHDDYIDSLALACIHFVNESNVGAWLV